MALHTVPMHGREYKSKKDILAAWLAGKDFLICDMSSRWDGKPVNVTDAERAGETVVNVRYKRLTAICVLVQKGDTWTAC